MTTGPIAVRAARATDLPELLRLEAECLADEAWTANMVEEELRRPGGMVCVAERADGGLVGFAIGFSVLGEVQLFQIATAASARRHGIGSALLIHFLAAHPHAGVAFLEVRARNAAAIAFYQAHDWSEIGRRPRYYSDGEDAIVMRVSLPYQPSAPKR